MGFPSHVQKDVSEVDHNNSLLSSDRNYHFSWFLSFRDLDWYPLAPFHGIPGYYCIMNYNNSKSNKDTTDEEYSENEKKKKTKRKEKRKEKNKKSFANILGILPKWGLVVVASGMALFWGMNVFLHFALSYNENSDSDGNPAWSSLSRLLRPRNGQQEKPHKDDAVCPSYGCLVFPREYKSAMVNASITRILEQQQQQPAPSHENAVPTLLTRTSNRKDPPFNQDAAVAIHPFSTNITWRSTDFFLGIFDGHGTDGHVTAQYFVRDVPQRLAQKFNTAASTQRTQEWIIQQIKDSFIEADEEAPRDIKFRGGCTASVTLRIGDTLYFANTGDSRTCLVALNPIEFKVIAQGPAPGVYQVYMTRQDKPHLPDEKARIEAAGGKIHIPPNQPMGSRVVVYSREFNDTIGLAMSRSLGDYEWTLKGVIPDPIVDVVDVRELRHNMSKMISNNNNNNNHPSEDMILFVIAASDGIWDLRLARWIQKQFAESFLPTSDARWSHPLIKMQQIIQRASPAKQQWYRDDMTAITMKIV